MRPSRFIILCATTAISFGCAAPPKIAPRFEAISTAPIAKAQADIAQKQTVIAQKQVETAQHIQKAEEIVKTLTIALPADKVKVDALTSELNNAQASNDDLKTENDSLKTENDSLKSDNDALTSQIDGQRQKCNQLSSDYDKLHAQDAKAQAIVKQVNRFWGIGAFGYGITRLVKHLFILIAVLAVVVIGVLILSFFFPFIIPALRTVGNVIAAAFRSISAVIRGL